MYKTKIKIDGMSCNMCESHVNNSIRKKLDPKKVTSSHKSGNVNIITNDKISKEQIIEALDNTGYKVISFEQEDFEEKKSIFNKLFGK